MKCFLVFLLILASKARFLTTPFLYSFLIGLNINVLGSQNGRTSPIGGRCGSNCTLSAFIDAAYKSLQRCYFSAEMFAL